MDALRHGMLSQQPFMENTEQIRRPDRAVVADRHVLRAPPDVGFYGRASLFGAVAGETGGVQIQLQCPEISQHLAAEIGTQSADALKAYLVISVFLKGRILHIRVNFLSAILVTVFIFQYAVIRSFLCGVLL